MKICENCYNVTENEETCSITRAPLCRCCYEKENKDRILTKKFSERNHVIYFSSYEFHPHHNINKRMFVETRRTLRAMKSGWYQLMTGGISFDLSNWTESELAACIETAIKTI